MLQEYIHFLIEWKKSKKFKTHYLITYLSIQDKDGMYDCYTELAEQIVRGIGDIEFVAHQQLVIGNIYAKMDDSDTAISCYQEALELYQQLNIPEEEVICLINIGLVFHSL